ncbi:MAG: hypothetical protein ACRDK3_09080 [Actinomycetota bacterium]
MKVLLIGLVVWWGPLLVVAAVRGGDDTLTRDRVSSRQARA